MPSDSNSSRAVRSASRGKNLYERMEEARARRAEALSNAPANDDARISQPSCGKNKAETNKADKTKAADTPSQGAETTPEPGAYSRSALPKKSRFPALVLRSAVVDGDKQPRRRFGWLRSL